MAFKAVKESAHWPLVLVSLLNGMGIFHSRMLHCFLRVLCLEECGAQRIIHHMGWLFALQEALLYLNCDTHCRFLTRITVAGGV